MNKMSTVTRLRADVGSKWSITEATELYDVARWGQGYFSINEQGHLLVHPTKEPARGVDLKRLIDRLGLRGLSAPVLLRFTDILRHRLGEIHTAFQNAITQHQYQGVYRCVYPIKVNQQRQVVEEVMNFGRQYGFGLEAGSKPELLAVAAMAENDTPIICNGFKDAEFIEMAMLAQKMGRLIIPVVEKYTELELILHYADKVGVRPNIGMRVKLAARGSGRWQSSGGYRSKFGLTVTEILRASRSSRRAACRTASSSCTSTSAARSPTFASSSTRSTRPRGSTASWPNRAPASNTWTSAAASAWTTTAHRPTSSRP
jgi:arginine decarboxylase